MTRAEGGDAHGAVRQHPATDAEWAAGRVTTARRWGVRAGAAVLCVGAAVVVHLLTWVPKSAHDVAPHLAAAQAQRMLAAADTAYAVRNAAAAGLVVMIALQVRIILRRRR